MAFAAEKYILKQSNAGGLVLIGLKCFDDLTSLATIE